MSWFADLWRKLFGRAKDKPTPSPLPEPSPAPAPPRNPSEVPVAKPDPKSAPVKKEETPTPIKPEPVKPAPSKPSPPKPEPAKPAPIKSGKKKVPTRTEMQQLVRDWSLGKLPNRLGVPYGKIRETNGKNRSAAIDAMNKTQGGYLGAPYCQVGVQEILDEKCRYYKISRKSVNIPEGAGTQDIWARTPKKYKQQTPAVGTWVNWRRGNTGQGHTGEVISYHPGATHMGTVEFNTSAAGAGVERDGEGAYYGLTRSIHGSGSLQINGYIDVYEAIVDAMIASGEWEA